MEECIREIVKKGIETEGIYRLSGNTSVVNKLKAMYNKGINIYIYKYMLKYYHF